MAATPRERLEPHPPRADRVEPFFLLAAEQQTVPGAVKTGCWTGCSIENEGEGLAKLDTHRKSVRRTCAAGVAGAGTKRAWP